MGLQKASGVAYYTVSIPQAVGTIAIAETVVLGVIAVLMVSIPQAVGTIAIFYNGIGFNKVVASFNTASGRYYCNISHIIYKNY